MPVKPHILVAAGALLTLAPALARAQVAPPGPPVDAASGAASQPAPKPTQAAPAPAPATSSDTAEPGPLFDFVLENGMTMTGRVVSARGTTIVVALPNGDRLGFEWHEIVRVGRSGTPPPRAAAPARAPEPPPAAPVVAPPSKTGADTDEPSESKGKAALVLGGLLFLGGYVTSGVVNSSLPICSNAPEAWEGCEKSGLGWVPFAGPFMMASTPDTADDYVGLMVALGVAQAGGAFVFFLGAASEASSGKKSGSDTALVIAPGPIGRGAGARVVGVF